MKKFEKNNVTIGLNVLYVKKEKVYSVYVSKHNSNREKQKQTKTLAMRAKSKERKTKSEGPRWHYLAVKKIISIIKRNNIKK